MKRFVTTFLLLFIFSCLGAQNNVVYDLEVGIPELEAKYVDAWKTVQKVSGYRIQIAAFSGHNSKIHIEAVKDKFTTEIPNIPAYISFFAPYFRLRVGDFSTKLEAYYALQKIAPFFEGAYIIKDDILLIDISDEEDDEQKKSPSEDELFEE